MEKDKKVFACGLYPEPKGTNYYQYDLMTEEKVEQLFDSCQILEAAIFKSGWDFLIDYFGYEKLFQINNRSGWFDAEDLDDFKQWIFSFYENS